MLPTPLLIDSKKKLWRIYYSGRDSLNRSAVSFFDLTVGKLQLKITDFSKEPILSYGRLGTFDDSGVSPSCLTQLSDTKQLLFYIGWNPGSTTRVNLYGGLAINSDNKGFTRAFESPLLERTPTDPFINTAPWVVNTGTEFYMYYVSGTEWKTSDSPRYNIKFATSKDGVNWKREGKVVLDFESTDETALARPYVIVQDNIWRMWFSKRVGNYSIGYAESSDGINWVRQDQKYGLETSENIYENEMVEYGVVIPGEDVNWILYNGNEYGKYGIHHAKGGSFDN